MPNPYFQFKQFIVRQDRCAMKVGTDGVLLGAWANTEGAKHVMDVGTGTGLVALMLAQRTESEILAVELDEQAANQAAENFTESPWSNQLSVVCADFLHFSSVQKFDAIVSNPPYFEQSLLSPNLQRTNARHTQTLNYESLISKAVELLSDNGQISLIFPVDKEVLLTDIATQNGLFVTRKCAVKPKPDSQPKRMLMEFSKIERETETTELVVEVSRHHYSPDYINLTKDFYLKM
ncbi:MAG: tRNA1(Val) (adenine(37)-N6)-methyltransferase [Bacteroidales bacterium]